MNNLLMNQNVDAWYNIWADFLAQNPFYQEDNSQKLSSIIKEICENLQLGNSCIYCEEYPSDLSAMIAPYNTQQNVEKPLVWDNGYLYLNRYWAMEALLAKCIVHLCRQPIIPLDLSPYLSLFEDPHQQRALQIGVNSAFAMITGGPGTGKTYILTRIVALLKKTNPELRIAMAAPTGKAAQRMQEALAIAFKDSKLQEAGLFHEDLLHQNTQTIHRLLGIGHQGIARYHRHQPLPYDVVVIDEASMLDLNLASLLLDAIQPPTRLILLGDANQLSSVDVGCVLADLQQVTALHSHSVRLQTSRRFSDEQAIGRFASFIQRQSDDQPTTFQQWLAAVKPQCIDSQQSLVSIPADQAWLGFYDLSVSPLSAIYHYILQGYQHYVEAIRQYQQGQTDKQELAQQFDRYRILVAVRYGDLGLTALNQMVSDAIKTQLNVSAMQDWYLGRPVMMSYNDYNLNLSNGDIGICVTAENGQFMVYFPSLNKEIAVARLPQNIQTAYALTIHKSQGSEFDHVAVVLDEQYAQSLLSRELLYTAITRAKKQVSLLATPATIEYSLKNKTSRISGLVQHLQRQFAM